MLRAVSVISLESPALDLLASVSRRDFGKLIRIKKYSSASNNQTVLTSEERRAEAAPTASGGAPPPPVPPAPVAAPRRAWTLAAAAVAAAASLGGVYFYRKLSDEEAPREPSAEPARAALPPPPPAYPEAGELLPRHVDFLLVGGGTASFAAMRAIRAARPEAGVLLVGEEALPPYMRPPLSKELWREPALGAADDELPQLTFRQWNGRRRPLLYEPLAFYTPVERLAAGGGAALARGWRVARLDVARHEAELRAPGREPVRLSYARCLVATGLRPRRLEVLRAARDAGRALVLRDARDAARLARVLDAPDARHVLLVGGGFLATELAAALAERLSAEGKRVTQVFREERPLERVLPPYLAAEAARRLRAAGVRLEPASELVRAEPGAGGVALTLRGADGAERTLHAAAVVECVGGELDGALARASGLEVADGALVVNAELLARQDVWAAGDAASWHDPALGRRRLEHHDHAVASGRRAGENMAAAPGAQRAYDHQPMFWSDLGPELGYEAIGVVDSRLSTVGVFSAEDVHEETAASAVGAAEPAPAEPGTAPEAGARRYDRGVVFYTREKRVVGILLWNLFNRMHVARQVLARGEFEDLFEVAKLFSLHEDD